IGWFSDPCCLIYTLYQSPISSNAITFGTICTLTTLKFALSVHHPNAKMHFYALTTACARLRQWLANNKLLLNKDKTEAITDRSSSVRSPTVISVCGATFLLKMAVGDIGVYIDIQLDRSAQVSYA
ncbi:hypothetical protein LSAT2_019065, partial [Lamellibrachia satsuma]